MTTSTTSSLRGIAKRALLASAAFPLSALVIADEAHAQQTVEVNATDTAANVQAAIDAAAATPDRDIIIDVTSKGVVTGPGSIGITAAVDQGDGAIEFSNAGSVGAVDKTTGAVTDSVSVVLIGSSGKADSTLAATNSGLITGGFQAFGFGGTVSLENSGTIHGGASLSATGDVDLVSTGAILSGSATAVSDSSSKATKAGDTTTTVTTGGDASLSVANVASADGKTKGAVFVQASAGSAEANVTGIAGDVTSQSFSGGSTNVSTSVAVPPADKTTVISENSNTVIAGSASVTTGSKSSVNSVTALANGNSTATIGGAVATNVFAGGLGGSASASKTTVTLDKAGGTLVEVNSGSASSILGNSTVTLAQTASVTGSVTANAVGNASIANAGKITGSTSANAGQGFKNASETTDEFDGKGAILSSVTEVSNSTQTGNATITNAATGVTVAGVSAFASGNATVDNSGQIGGGVSATAGAGSSFDSLDERTYDGKGNQVASDSTQTSASLDGNSSVINAATATITGGVNATATQNISIANAGKIGGGVNANSSGQTDTNSSSSLTPVAVVDAKAGTTTTTSTSSFENLSARNSGKIDFANATGAIIGLGGTGNVSLTAGGDISILNQGEVRGTTFAQSTGTATSSEGSTVSTFVDDGKGGFTNTVATDGASSFTATGGSVSGTYAGANGTDNFFPGANGSVTQRADLASTVSVTGSVFGDVSSRAGLSSVAGSTSKSSSLEVEALDAAGTGSYEFASTGESAATAIVGGDSNIVVSGEVAFGNANFSADVNSLGTNSSTVVISGFAAENVNSAAIGAGASEDVNAFEYAQTVTKFTAVTDTLTDNFSSTSVVNDGAASATISGAATPIRDTVGSSVNVSGVSSATAVVASKAIVAGGLSVRSDNGTDTEEATERSYVRNSATAIATAEETSTSLSGPSAAQGDAQATVAGTVRGSTNVAAGRGNATVTLTGITSSVSAETGGNVNEVSRSSVWTGKTSSASANFNTLVASLTGRTLEQTTTETNTVVGGTANVIVDTAQEFSDKALTAASSVFASGVAGASVSITAPSRVSGDVEAQSFAFSTVETDTFSDNGKAVNTTQSSKVSITGGPAIVTNAGQIGDDVFVGSATSATLDNTGKIGDNTNVAAVATSFDFSQTVTNSGNAALQVVTSTSTPVIALGVASVTNAAGATIGGDVSVAGAEGTVTNAGVIGGTIVFGENFDTASSTTVLTDTTTNTTITPAAALLVQKYTVNQNGVSGGVSVVGGLDNSGATKTSDVTATVNLNSGSATLGSIVGEVDKAGVRTTNTTVNLNGSGFLGADANRLDKPTPLAQLNKDAQNLFVASNYEVQVIGVETLNKEAAGTFVINGTPYEAAAPGGKATYTLDVGSFNIKAGEVQLTTSQAPDAEFGIRGNINNDATLVLGRRIAPGQNPFGNSIVGQAEAIDGISIRQVGDYNQTANGVTVVGVTPTLVRTANPAVVSDASLPELLAPVTGGVRVGYFTTPPAEGYTSDNSEVNLTGNLNLAGRVSVNVARDAIYANGDGYTLFTYTGTGAVTATAAPTLTSPYVAFGLVHDATAKVVRLEVRRSSYAGGATNPNAASAAVGLDTALTSAIARIRTDAAGGSGFASVTELGYAQDIANVAAALDFRLSSAQAAEVYNELSSAEIYGSLAAIDQNGVFGQTLDMLTNRRSSGGNFATQIWLNPVGNWATYGDGEEFGASEIRSNSYGMAGGIDLAYAEDGAFGFGAAYSEHDVEASGTPEVADGHTWTFGAYATQGFGPIYANAELAYGWTNFDVARSMALLARVAEGSVNARQFDASIEVGYDYNAGNFTVTPFGKLALRSTKFEAFTETGAGAFSLNVAERSASVFSPVFGVKLGTEAELSNIVTLRPFARLAYTIQGNLPNDVTVQYVGGGSTFVLDGAEPDSFGSIDAGVEARVANQVNLFVSGSQTFGGDNKVSSLRSGLAFQF